MNKTKKPLAVVLIFALLITLWVPVGAETATSQADALKAAGLFTGTNSGYNLTGLLTRDQGIALALRAQGMEPSVLKQTPAEVAAVMLKVTDAASIPGWAKPYVAFALKQTPPITAGVSAVGDKVVFAPAQRMSGKQFISFLARAMGYSTTLDTGMDIAMSATMLSAGQIVKYSSIPAMNREQAVDILYSVVRTGQLNGTKQLVINKLVAAGIVPTAAAITLGYALPAATPTPTPVATPTPELARLAVSEIQVPNTKQIKVVFNRELLQDTVLAANFIVKEAGTTVRSVLTAIQPDKKSVMLTLDGQVSMSNFTTVDVTVKKALKDVTGTTLDSDYTKTGISVQDTKVPELVGAEALGKKLIRLTFDEPVWNGSSESFSTSQFAVKNGTYSYMVLSAKAVYQDRSILLSLGTDILPGNLTVTINALPTQSGQVRDFINFMTPNKDTVVSYPATISEATANVESVNKTTRLVTIRFNKPVYGTNVRLYQMVNRVDAYGSSLVSKSESMASDKWEFTMPAAIPTGNVNFFLTNSAASYEQMRDLFGVAVSDRAMIFNNVADTTAPSVLSITSVGNTAFDITFSEELDAVAAQKEANYEVRNTSGTIVPVTDAVLMPDLQTVRIVTSLTDLQTYTIKVSAIKDTVGNILNSWSTTKTVTDSSNPKVVNAFAVPEARKIFITFSEAMNQLELAQKTNYLVDRDGGTGNMVALGEYDTVTVTDAQHIVLTLNSAITTPSVKMAAMHDLSGKKLGSDLTFEYSGEAGNLINIGPETLSLEKVELVDRNMAVLTFNTAVGTFEPTDFLFRQKVDGGSFTYPVQVLNVKNFGINANGQSEFLVQLDRTLNSDATWNDNTSRESIEIQVVAGKTVSSNKALISARTHATALGLQDAVGGAIARDLSNNQLISWHDFDNNGRYDTVVVKYDEAIKEASIMKSTFSISGYTIIAASVDSDGIVFAGNQGDHTAASCYVILNISSSVADPVTKPEIIQASPIMDAAGNIIE